MLDFLFNRPRYRSPVLLVIALFVAGCNTPTTPLAPPTTDLSVMSFNIRNGKANDGPNRWQPRKPLVFDVIRQHDPDLVGIQEAYRFQMDDLRENLPAYSEIGEGRDGGTRNEYAAILYRTQRFAVKDSGTFWLSDTPNVVSKHWGNQLHRVCTWARFYDKNTGRYFYLFNTHLDHQSQNARLNSAKLIASHIAPHANDHPVILTGDFNAGEGNPVIKYLKGSDPGQGEPQIALLDSFRVLHPDRKQAQTGNAGYKGRRDGAKIDYVFITPGIKVLAADIDQEPRDGRYPSDHYPVWAHLRLMHK